MLVNDLDRVDEQERGKRGLLDSAAGVLVEDVEDDDSV